MGPNAMRGFLLALGILFVAPSLCPSDSGVAWAKKRVAQVGFNARTVEKHLRDHQRYPATKAQLLAECDELTDFTDADKRWFTSKLPDGTYHSPEEVLEAIGLKAAKK